VIRKTYIRIHTIRSPPLVTARLSSMDFLLPAHVGNVLNLTAWVTFSSRRYVKIKFPETSSGLFLHSWRLSLFSFNN
jgi:acyl-CoA hydrolase